MAGLRCCHSPAALVTVTKSDPKKTPEMPGIVKRDAASGEASASAADAIERGNVDQLRHYREVSAKMGAQRAAMAANGLDVSFGSAADIVADTALIGEEDAKTLADNNAKDVRGYLIQGANYQAEAASQRAGGRAAVVSGIFGAANSILGGATQYKKLKNA